MVTPLALDERLLRLPKLLSVQGVDNAIAYGTLGQALAQLFAFFLGNACLHAVGAPRVVDSRIWILVLSRGSQEYGRIHKKSRCLAGLAGVLVSCCAVCLLFVSRDRTSTVKTPHTEAFSRGCQHSRLLGSRRTVLGCSVDTVMAVSFRTCVLVLTRTIYACKFSITKLPTQHRICDNASAGRLKRTASFKNCPRIAGRRCTAHGGLR